MTNILFIFLTIADTISSFVEPYITQALNLLSGFDAWIQALILLSIGIFTLIGIIVFIKKFIKLFLVLAILGAIGYYLFTQGYLDGILYIVNALPTSIIFGL